MELTFDDEPVQDDRPNRILNLVRAGQLQAARDILCTMPESERYGVQQAVLHKQGVLL